MSYRMTGTTEKAEHFQLFWTNNAGDEFEGAVHYRFGDAVAEMHSIGDKFMAEHEERMARLRETNLISDEYYAAQREKFLNLPRPIRFKIWHAESKGFVASGQFREDMPLFETYPQMNESGKVLLPRDPQYIDIEKRRQT